MIVIAKKTYPQLEGIFKKGDTLELISKLSKKEKLIHSGYLSRTDKRGYLIERIKISEPVIAPVGNYEGYTITNEQGVTYSDSTIRGAIGYKTLAELFDKV